MMADPRLAGPKAFAHVRRELGIEARPGERRSRLVELS
jgi:hypothetical protein